MAENSVQSGCAVERMATRQVALFRQGGGVCQVPLLPFPWLRIIELVLFVATECDVHVR